MGKAAPVIAFLVVALVLLAPVTAGAAVCGTRRGVTDADVARAVQANADLFEAVDRFWAAVLESGPHNDVVRGLYRDAVRGLLHYNQNETSDVLISMCDLISAAHQKIRENDPVAIIRGARGVPGLLSVILRGFNAVKEVYHVHMRFRSDMGEPDGVYEYEEKPGALPPQVAAVEEALRTMAAAFRVPTMQVPADFFDRPIIYPANLVWYTQVELGTSKSGHESLVLLVSMALTVKCSRAPDCVLVDVGASTGSFSTSPLWVDNLRVIAFEPQDSPREALVDMLRVNGIRGRVDVRDVALGQVDPSVTVGTAMLGLSHFMMDSGLATTLNPRARLYYPGSFTNHTVSVSSLDVELGGIQRLDLLKIDVEGAELNVLRGGLETIKTHRPIILLEVNHRNICAGYEGTVTPGDVLGWLIDQGYRMASLSAEDVIACHHDGPDCAALDLVVQSIQNTNPVFKGVLRPNNGGLLWLDTFATQSAVRSVACSPSAASTEVLA